MPSKIAFARVIALSLILLMVISQIGWFETASSDVAAGDEFPRTGRVTVNTSANIREDPSTNKTEIDKLFNNHPVTVVKRVEGQVVGDNKYWYQINYKNSNQDRTGYIHSSLVFLDPIAPDEVDEEFEAYLNEQKFPSSYRPMLRALHAQYPEWKFKALHVNRTWEDAVNGQTRTGVSLIENTVNDNWKSTASASYDWLKDEWRIYDGNRWVMASKGVIAYYMDPRNMLGASSVFQFENLANCEETHTRQGVENILKNTFMAGKSITRYDDNGKAAGSVSYVDAFMEAAKKSGVSPYHLASRVVQEVGTGGSDSVSGTYKGYEGYYNFFNIGAPSSSDPVARGLGYAMYGPKRKPVDDSFSQADKDYLKLLSIPWNNRYDSIMGGAMFLGNNYVRNNQNTLYLQRFNLLASSYPSHQYMTNIRAVASEATRFARGYSEQDALENGLEFLIPVYKDMPKDPVALPAASGNPNHWLSRLRVDGSNVTPSFKPDTRTGYSIIVENMVRSVEITATPVNSKARINSEKAGTYKKKHDLKPGDNIIKLEVRAENGSKRTYEVNVYRRLADPTKLNSELYIINDTHITGLDMSKELHKIENLKKHLNVPEDHKIRFVDLAGKEAVDTVGTGFKAELILADQVVGNHTFIIFGDTNGSGRVSIADVNNVLNHITQRKSLKGDHAVAADANRDGKISIADLNLVINHAVERSTIKQD